MLNLISFQMYNPKQVVRTAEQQEKREIGSQKEFSFSFGRYAYGLFGNRSLFQGLWISLRCLSSSTLSSVVTEAGMISIYRIGQVDPSMCLMIFG